MAHKSEPKLSSTLSASKPAHGVKRVKIEGLCARHEICARFFCRESRRKESWALKPNGTYFTFGELNRFLDMLKGLTADVSGNYYLNNRPITADELFKGFAKGDPKLCKASPDASAAAAARLAADKLKGIAVPIPDLSRVIVKTDIDQLLVRHGICARFVFTKNRRKESFALKSDGSYFSPKEVNEFMNRIKLLKTDSMTGEYFLKGVSVSIDELFKDFLRGDPATCQPPPDAAAAAAAWTEAQRKKNEKKKEADSQMKLKLERGRFNVRAEPEPQNGFITASFVRYAQYLGYTAKLLTNQWQEHFAALYTNTPAYAIGNTDEAFKIYTKNKLDDELRKEFPELSSKMHRSVFDVVFKAAAMAQRSRRSSSKDRRIVLKRAIDLRRIVLEFVPDSVPSDASLTIPQFDGKEWTPNVVEINRKDWEDYAGRYQFPAGEAIKLRLFGSKCLIDLPGTKIPASESEPKPSAVSRRSSRIEQTRYFNGQPYYNCRIFADTVAVDTTVRIYCNAANTLLPYFLNPVAESDNETVVFPSDRQALQDYVAKVKKILSDGAIPALMLKNEELLLNAAVDARETAAAYQKKLELWETKRAAAAADVETKAQISSSADGAPDKTADGVSEEIAGLIRKIDAKAPKVPKNCKVVPLIQGVLPKAPAAAPSVAEGESKRNSAESAGTPKPDDWNLGTVVLPLCVPKEGWKQFRIAIHAEDWALVRERPYMFLLDKGVRLWLSGKKPILSIPFR